MKNIIKSLAFLALIVGAIFIAKPSMAADPAPQPPQGHGSNGNHAPAGAPIDGGLGILLALGAAYGGRKLFLFNRDKKKTAEGNQEDEVCHHIGPHP